MSLSNIIDKQFLKANTFQRKMINRMYDSSVYEDTIVEKITYLSDGLKVNGYIARPKNFGTYPLLLWNRGGYKDDGAITDLTAFLILASTAVWGYNVAATQYRGNMGGEGQEDWGGNDVNDALNLLEIVSLYPSVDKNRVAIEGASRGGMTTYRALAKDHRFKCAIVHAGLSDLFEMATYRDSFGKLVDKLTRDMTPDIKDGELSKRSGIYLAEKFPKGCPILLLHGTADETVPISQSKSMAKELKRLGLPHKYVEIENGGHIALKDESYRQIDPIRKLWLEELLK